MTGSAQSAASDFHKTAAPFTTCTESIPPAFGGVDLLGDSSIAESSPRVTALASNSMDLLGDEIEAPTPIIPDSSNAPLSITEKAHVAGPAVAAETQAQLSPAQALTFITDSAALDNHLAAASPITSAMPSSPDSRHGSSADSQSLPSARDGDGVDSADSTGAPGDQEPCDEDERVVDSDREVVEEEDAFGDFADFTTASKFLPGGGLGAAAAPSGSALPPPPAARAAGAGSSSPSTHRFGHLGGPRLGGSHGSGPTQHLANVSGAVSDHGSLGGEFSDFGQPSPPPSVAPSRAGGGRKSVASIASVGSRAGGDDDVGDYGSVVGSSVWRAPSQMATSSYAAAAGADDDFGDFTSDITSTSDFAPSTQPPSAVAVSGPGSVHPDDDFGSFASHRSTADDDEDDFGNFNAAPASGAGPSASGAPGGSAAAAGSSFGAAAGGSGSTASGSGGVGLAGFDSGAPSPRDPTTAGGNTHAYHSTQSVGPTGADTPPVADAAALLQLPPSELRHAVARALQPLLPPAVSAVPLSAGHNTALPEEQVTAAWAQLRRQVQGALLDGSVAAHTGLPLGPLGSGAVPEVAAGRGGYASTIKYTRPLRWKGSDSERRLLASLGLSELAAQARALEAMEAPQRPVGRGRADSAGGSSGRQLGPLANFGDAPCRTRGDAGYALGTSQGASQHKGPAEGAASLPPSATTVPGSSCRTRPSESAGDSAAAAASIPEWSPGPPGAWTGGSPRAVSGGSGPMGPQQQLQEFGSVLKGSETGSAQIG